MARPRIYHVLDGKKECSQCHTSKLLSQFGNSAKASDGHQAECKDCHKRRYNPVYPRDESILEKQCSACGKTKLAGQFYNDPSTKSGIKAACKDCTEERNNGWAKDNPDKRKTIANRWFRKAYADPTKREVFAERVDEWREANPEKVREHRATDMAKNGQKPARIAKRRQAIQRFFVDRPGYRQAAAHKRRALLKEATIVDALVNVWVLYERDHGICTLCGFVVDRTLQWPDLRMATIDHYLSLTRGGEHSYPNTKLAHHYCNTLKNNRLETPEVLASIRRQFVLRFVSPGAQLSLI
jgi:hypothetical protein